MRIRLGTTFFALGLLVFTGAGCSSTNDDPGAVQREWSRNLRELGIVPVFPPREDLYVGDVFLYAFDPDSAHTEAILLKKYDRLKPKEQAVRRQIGMSTRWFSVDLREALQAEYERRLSLTETPLADNVTVDSLASARQPVAPHSIFVGDRQNPDLGRVNRARLVAFPEFSATATNAADIRALVPIEAFRAGLNVAYRDIDSVTVRVPVAESYGLSVQTVLDSLAPVASSARTEDEIANQLTRATAVEFERQMRIAVQEQWTINRTPPEARQLDELTIQALVPAYRDALNGHVRWRRAGDPALDDSKWARVALGVANEALDAAEKSPVRGGIVAEAAWVNSVRRFKDFFLSAFAYRRKLGRAVRDGAAVLNEIDAARFAAFVPEDAESRTVYLRVITEVFYARAIDVSVTAKSATGVRGNIAPAVQPKPSLQLQPQPQPPAQPQPQPPSIPRLLVQPTPTTKHTTSGATKPATEQATQSKPPTAQRQQQQQSTTPPPTTTPPTPVESVGQSLGEQVNLPGGTVQLVSTSDRTVGLRRVYHRPVAIGTRGVTLAIDVNTGMVLRASVTGGVGPTNVK